MSSASEPMSAAIGVLGGTFDPVHYGHLRAAVEVRERLGLSGVKMVPSAQPPHRQAPWASAEHRMAMLRRAISCQDFLAADDCEMRRQGPSYMVDTLSDIRRGIGDAPLVLIIGQDAANGLDRWHEWRELFELAHVAVMRRPDAESDYRDELAQCMARRMVTAPGALHAAPAGLVIDVAITQLDISSTAIRALIAAGQSAHYLTPPRVIEYIRQHGLYSGPVSA